MIIKAHGVDIYTEQHGQGKPDVLLLHGWGCSTELWKPVTARLSSRARVTVIDFPGHGQSGRPPTPWGTEDFADMTAELLDGLDIASCDVIGHSHGGRVALMLAIRHPEKVDKLLLTGAAGLRGEPAQAQKNRTAHYKRLKSISDSLDKIKILGPLPEKMREALRKRYGSADYNALDAEMRKTFVKVVNTDLKDRLCEVMAPTLLVWGSEDTATPLWMGREMEKSIPDAGLAILQGGTHYAYLEMPDAFLRIAEHFLFGGK